MCTKFSLAGAVFAAFLVILNPFANATPYASGVRVDAGTVTFILNESADNVTVVFDGGASTEDLGGRLAGRHSFDLGTAYSFEIVVKSTNSTPGYTQGVLNQISSDSNILNRFVNQRGVTVNENPNSPAFGRIYVSVATAGSSGGRTLGEGIYVLNADHSEVAGLGTNALTGGLIFPTGTAGSESPYRLTLAADDNLYIADWSDANGSLYVTDANVANGQNVLFGAGGPCPLTTSRVHGSIAASWIEGSLATSDLTVYVIDEDLQGNRDAACTPAGAGTERNSIWRWDIGAGPLAPNTLPTKFAAPLIRTDPQLADLTRGPDGKWYASQRRAEPANTTGLVVLNPDGTTAWSSLTATRAITPGATDFLGETVAIDVSRNGKYIVALRRDNAMTVVPLVDGLPDLANRVLLVTSPTTVAARDVAFDAAGNIYAVSSGNSLLRVFSPGGNTIATTRSDGTFDLTVIELPKVSVAVTDNEAAEEGVPTAEFTLTRTGDLSEALTVNYTMSGAAVNGDDYETLPLSVEFAAGESTATVIVTPINDGVAEFSETVTLNLAFTSLYSVQAPTNATATILDNEPVTLRLTAGSKTNVYEPLPRDAITLTVSRLGSLEYEIFAVELLSVGAATELEDFVLSANLFTIEPNVVSKTVTVMPVNDSLFEGNETLTIMLGESFEYTNAPQHFVTAVIRDDEQASAPILFSEDFTDDASGNWQIRFGANNGIYDATVQWQYDYSQAGVGPAPNTWDGSTSGLYAAVNKSDSTAGGSAGINLYPIGKNFSGDYALRFDMYLSYGAASTTEHALLGINHSGNNTNRATQSTDANNTTRGGDGFWVGIVTDASNLQDYSGYTYPTPTSLPTVVASRAASTLTSLITSPPYSAAGSPGSSGTNKSWSIVELKQVNNLISLKVNDILIWEHQNTNAYTSGNIMLGMNDQFDSVGPAQHFVVFDNVRVVNLSTDIEITRVELVGANQVQIDFTSPAGGAASGYTLRAKGSLAEADWVADAGANITSLGGTQYRAVATRSGGERYYSVTKP